MAWLMLFLLSYLTLRAGASNAEGNALYAVKESLNDTDGILKSWNINLVDPCSWNFVTCDDKKNVIAVSLAAQGFTGNLSPQIANLPKLQTLELQNNLISGWLPNALGNLTYLQSLNAHNNSFTGYIPSSLGQLSNLKYLTLSNNKLRGGIPNTITEIPSLLSLDLAFNNLTGLIPNAAFKIPEYNFVGNQLTCALSGQTPCQLTKSKDSLLPQQVSSLQKSNVAALAGGIVAGSLLLIAAIAVFFM